MNPSSRVIACSTVVDADVDRLYAIYVAAERWHEWDPDTLRAYLPSGASVGDRGWLKPAKGFRVPLRVVSALPGRQFSVEAPVLGSRMRFDHDLEPGPAAGQAKVTHRVAFSGWLAPWLMRTVGEDLKAGLPRTLDSLRTYVASGAQR